MEGDFCNGGSVRASGFGCLGLRPVWEPDDNEVVTREYLGGGLLSIHHLWLLGLYNDGMALRKIA